jgi:hypothetical protein
VEPLGRPRPLPPDSMVVSSLAFDIGRSFVVGQGGAVTGMRLGVARLAGKGELPKNRRFR